MSEFRLSGDDRTKLKKQLGVRGSVIAVGLPPELVSALGIRSTSVLERDKWKNWIVKIPKVDCFLLWIEERRDDDQEFLQRLARHLPKKAVLWSFHAMSVLLSDRLTGDAVQTLLLAGELDDKGCRNVGVGYYARRFVRARGSKAQAVERKKTTKVVVQAGKDVQKRNTIRTQKVREALERSKNLQSSASMKQALEDEKTPRRKKVAKKSASKKASKKKAKTSGAGSKKPSKNKVAKKKTAKAKKKSKAKALPRARKKPSRKR